MRQQTVIQMSVQRLSCSACGAEANASCDCGKPYVPARQRARQAVEANPQKSDRAIAADLGVSPDTVGRARKESGVRDQSPERVGRDGKVYRFPVRDDEPDEATESAEHDEGLRVIAVRGFLNRATEAKEIATVGKLQPSDVTEAMIDAANDAAAAWSKAAQNLRDMING